MRKIILLLLLACGCTNDDGAKNALQSQGFTNIRLTGYRPWACSKDDFSSTGFRATNPQGAEVSGVVCCGMIFKSCTVRF